MSDLVDWVVALDSVGGDADLLREVVDAFLAEAPRQLLAAETAIRNSDHVAMRRAAHTLKGNARYFGAREVFDLAFELEVLGEKQQFDRAQEIRAKLSEAMARLTPVLLDYVGRK